MEIHRQCVKDREYLEEAELVMTLERQVAMNFIKGVWDAAIDVKEQLFTNGNGFEDARNGLPRRNDPENREDRTKFDECVFVPEGGKSEYPSQQQPSKSSRQVVEKSVRSGIRSGPVQDLPDTGRPGRKSTASEFERQILTLPTASMSVGHHPRTNAPEPEPPSCSMQSKEDYAPATTEGEKPIVRLPMPSATNNKDAAADELVDITESLFVGQAPKSPKGRPPGTSDPRPRKGSAKSQKQDPGLDTTNPSRDV